MWYCQVTSCQQYPYGSDWRFAFPWKAAAHMYISSWWLVMTKWKYLGVSESHHRIYHIHAFTYSALPFITSFSLFRILFILFIFYYYFILLFPPNTVVNWAFLQSRKSCRVFELNLTYHCHTLLLISRLCQGGERDSGNIDCRSQ